MPYGEYKVMSGSDDSDVNKIAFMVYFIVISSIFLLLAILSVIPFLWSIVIIVFLLIITVLLFFIFKEKGIYRELLINEKIIKYTINRKHRTLYWKNITRIDMNISGRLGLHHRITFYQGSMPRLNISSYDFDDSELENIYSNVIKKQSKKYGIELREQDKWR